MIPALARSSGLTPACVIDAIYHDRFWVLSHPAYLEDIRHRNESLHGLENPSLLRKLFKDNEEASR